MSAALETDLSALVGELEQIPCELPQHGRHPIHTDAPASHYVRSRCPVCKIDTGVIAACPGFVATVRSNAVGICRNCNTKHKALDMVTILGLVSA
jgi:hypothetical protein